jgi:hypothetical protein
MNRRLFFGLFTGALAAMAAPLLRRFHPDLLLRRVHIYRAVQEGDFVIYRGVEGGPHPMTAVRVDDVIKIVSDERDTEHDKLYRVLTEPRPTDDPYSQGRVVFDVEEVC